jgi:cytochrome bd ubiquinol oxidase subunit II
MEPTWLPIFWAGVIAFAILVYVILDGYDLGVGILFGTTRNEQHRATMMNAIAPFWDGNETWLVLIGAGLFAAFPMVYAIFLPAFYLPITLMLFGLIFRGVAFEFRYRSERMRPVWDWGFFLGSLVATFVQGAAIGRMVEELPVVDGRYVGGAFKWVTPFSLLCGVGLVLGYALLGAAWLVLKTDGDMRDWAYHRLDWLLGAVIVVLIAVFAFALATQLRVLDRWLVDLRLVSLQLLGVIAVVGLVIGVRQRHDGVPFAMAILLVTSAFLRLGVSFWPYMIPYSVTVQEAAAPTQSLEFLFWGAGVIVFPVVLIYTAVVYWIFRGKVRKVAPAYANGAGVGTTRRPVPSPRLSSTRQR